MRRLFKFVAVLVLALGLLVALGYAVLARTTQKWFESDLSLRSRLAVASARESLSNHWQAEPTRLRETLSDITRDERIMAAAACSSSGRLLAATDGYPSTFSCASLASSHPSAYPGGVRDIRSSLPSGPVLLSVVEVEDSGRALGAVVLVQDLNYLARREATTLRLLLVAFIVLAGLAAFVTLLAARFAWRGWTLELRRALLGQGAREFQPLLRDVRELAQRLANERGQEARSGAWSAARLRATLTQHLHGEQIVILANREPYMHQSLNGKIQVLHPASGLVTALEPVLRACSGVWVGHGSGSADRATVDARDRVRVPPGEESYAIRRVWLSEAEENGYYYGFSNEGLWPLCHVAHTRPVFRAEDWEHYVRVNRKFAEAVCEEVDSADPIVLVQDYHFALAPKMIRERLPQATIITFWHTPWPNAERIGICPWREELISGLLGSSVMGFQTQQHCNNFIDSVDAFMESRIDRESNAVTQGQRRTLVRPYPISIEWPVRWLDHVPRVELARERVREELGLAPDALLGVGIDRLDYTKGIEERLSSVDELLTRYAEFRGRFTFVQLAAPSRTKIPRYRELNDRVEELSIQINAKWARGRYRPIVLLREHHEPSTVSNTTAPLSSATSAACMTG